MKMPPPLQIKLRSNIKSLKMQVSEKKKFIKVKAYIKLVNWNGPWQKNAQAIIIS